MKTINFYNGHDGIGSGCDVEARYDGRNLIVWVRHVATDTSSYYDLSHMVDDGNDVDEFVRSIANCPELDAADDDDQERLASKFREIEENISDMS